MPKLSMEKSAAEVSPRKPRRVNVAALTPISEAMGADKSPKEVLELIIKAAFSITRASSASLMLVDEASETLIVEVAEGFHGKRIYNTRLQIGQGVTGWVAETGVPLRLGNVSKDPRYICVQSNLRSELAVPLKIHGKIVGVISVDSTRLNHFTAEDEALLSSLAAQSARVIQTTHLYEETRRRAKELELLSEVSRSLSTTLDLRQVLAHAVEQTAKLYEAAGVAVYLSSDDGVRLEVAASHGTATPHSQGHSVPLKTSLLGRIIESGKPVIFQDLSLEKEGSELLMNAEALALLAVPLVAKNKAMGILCVYAAKSRQFDSHDHRP